MKEADDHQWKKLLGKIPPVSIPDALDSAINDQIDDMELKRVLQRLPEFSPPPHLEVNIEKRSQNKIEFKYWLKIACSILLVLSAWIFVSKCRNDKQNHITIIAENQEFNATEINGIEFYWSSLKDFCTENGMLCEGVKFEELNKEWTILQEAKNELLDATTIYDRESYVQNQITYIETRQTVIINELLELM